MQELFVYAVIMMIIGLFGYVRKMQEEREARKQQEQKPLNKADLPPETRRQLYGDQGHTVREARPAQKQSQPQVVPPPVRRQQAAPAKRQAAPARRQQEDVRERSVQRVPTAKQAQRQTPSQRTASAPATFDRMRRALEQMAESVQEQAQKRAGLPEAPPAVPPQRPAVAPRQLGKSAEQLAGEQARRQAQLRGQRGAIKTTSRQVAVAPDPTTKSARRRQVRLFGNLNDVRRGIVISEVLGPPKGLQ